MLDGLAFLPVPMVSDGMAYIRETAPEERVPIIDYFDSNYVSGAYRAVMGNGRMRFRRTPPRFELQMWNVHDATITNCDCARTNNICESWNNGFKHLVGHSNPSLWSVIECLVKDNAETETEVYRHSTDTADDQEAEEVRNPTSTAPQVALSEDTGRIPLCRGTLGYKSDVCSYVYT